MAWPFDDRDHDFSVLGQVPASTLNDIQDKIIELAQERTRVFFPTITEGKAGDLGDMAWTPAGATGFQYWSCSEAGRDLFIPLHLDEGAIITGVLVKMYEWDQDGLRAYLDKLDLHTDDTDTDAPTFSNIEAPAATTGTFPRWEVVDLCQSGPYTIGTDEVYMVRIASADAADQVSGVTVTYKTITGA